MSQHKLSFWTAVLVNLNVMFGAGYFINTVILAQTAGFFGFLSYLLVALLLIPLILCIAELLRLIPEGGFYSYARENISPLAGFISSWAYFTGKLASAALLVHVFSSLIVSLFPFCAVIPLLVIDVMIIFLFAWLTMLRMKTGRIVLYTFLVFKMGPLLFTLISCLYLYHYWTIPSHTLLFSGIPMTIPLVLFAFTGFEACCSISGSLEDSKKNGPRVIFLTYGLVVGLTILYQFFFFLTAGKTLMMQHSYIDVFPTLFDYLLPGNVALAHHAIALLHIALACACLGGSYAILFSNHWNLYALAKHGHTFFAPVLTRFNAHALPVACIVIEACICIAYLLFTQGAVVVLQQISVLGVTIGYTLSVASLFMISRSLNQIKITILSCLGLISCSWFISMCIRNFYLYGLSAFYLFSLILLFGLGMFLLTRKRAI